MGSLFKTPKAPAPPPPPPSPAPMPDPEDEALLRARRRKVAGETSKSGYSSTILSNGDSGKLGS